MSIRHSLGLILATVALAGCESPVTMQSSDGAAKAKGAREAEAEVAAGRLKIKEYPALPSPAQHGEYIALLREMCGAEYEVISSDDPKRHEALLSEVQAWNGAMYAELRRRHGPDILEELHAEAERRWKAKLKK
jgi:hypothetical protein